MHSLEKVLQQQKTSLIVFIDEEQGRSVGVGVDRMISRVRASEVNLKGEPLQSYITVNAILSEEEIKEESEEAMSA